MTTWRAAWKATPETGQRLTRWREDHNLTKSALARYLGVSETAIRYWESGTRPIQHEHILRLALLHYDCKNP
jgi:transcriptional regulator with XRE-family HTH domain